MVLMLMKKKLMTGLNEYSDSELVCVKHVNGIGDMME